MNTRQCFVLFTAIALAGCGGSGSGGNSGSGSSPVLAAQIAYDAQSGDLFTPVRDVPSISGLNGKVPKCAVTSGSLPPGVSLFSDCSIGGAPTQLGSFHATVTLTVDGVDGSVSAGAAVSVTAPALLKIRDASGGTADQQLRLLAPVSSVAVVKLAQGSNSYVPQTGDVLSYAVVSGALPAGLALNAADGTLGGTPSVYGTSAASISLAITRGGQTFTTAPVQVTFNTVEGPFTLSYFDCCVAAFVGGAVDMQPISTYVPVPGATSRFSVDSTSAPQGVTLDPVTGIYSGKLTAAGTSLSVVITQTVTYPDGSTSSARWSSQSWTVLATAPPQLQYMQQVGSLADGAMSISITPTQYNGITPPQIAGSIDMAGFLGTLGVNIGAQVSTITSSNLVDATGKPYVSIVLDSKPFVFIDLTTGTRTTATIRTVSDNVAGTRGHLAFTVTATQTGSVLASSVASGSQAAALALSSGSTTIKGF